MKKFLLAAMCASTMLTATVYAETVTVNEKTYEITTLIDYDLGPGVRYTRLRLPSYPLNVNMLRIDVTNPHNSVEVTQGSDQLYSTELLTKAAARQTTTGHVALAGANANFWCVSSQQPPYSDQIAGATYNGNLRNGKIITETNSKADQYNGGLAHTGITGISVDNKVYSSNNFSWEGFASNDKVGDLEIYQCNKIVRDEEIGLYNSFYPDSRTFRCCDQEAGTDGKQHFNVVQNCATEVYLSLDEGQEWSAGNPMTFTVKEVKANAGNGTLGSYDAALVGRGTKAEALAKLSAGDKVTVRYSWIDPDGNRITMNNLIGGNAQVMVNGTLTKYNTSETYNSQVYSRTGYGCSADGKTLYIIVIDKATDPVYGTSAGCSTTVMCEIAKVYGCVSMTNCDAGGSAEMLVGNKIINKTTESSPRAVANGMIAYDIAPEDNTVARLEFYDYVLKSPIYATSSPRVIAYNKYGSVLNDDFRDYILSCPAEAGTCNGNSFMAGGQGMTTTLTASYGDVTITKPLTIVETQLSLRIKPLLIDMHRTYPIEVTATIDENTYSYDPASINWTIADDGVVAIDRNGVLTGIAEGKTTITATIGEFCDTTNVTVESAKAHKIGIDGESIDPATWKFNGSSVKNGVITATGTNSGMGLSFSISSTRSPRITISKEILLYSLPDAFEIEVKTDATPVSKIEFNVFPRSESRPVKFSYDTEIPANTTTTINVPVSEFGDTDDLLTYPLTFKSLTFYLGGQTGAAKLDIPSFSVLYNNIQDAVDNIAVDSTATDAAARYYTIDGIEVSASSLVPGLYIRVAGNKTEKVIIR